LWESTQVRRFPYRVAQQMKNYPNCTNTSSPSIFTGNTSTFARSGGSAIPVSVLKAHECQGQTTAFPSSHPCPSGPCRCGQTLSTAASVPSTFARQIETPAASASITPPTAGASPTAHNRTHSATHILLKIITRKPKAPQQSLYALPSILYSLHLP